MTWKCAACGTTVTWAEPVDGNPGMQACQRCSRWMDLIPEGRYGTEEGDGHA